MKKKNKQPHDKINRWFNGEGMSHRNWYEVYHKQGSYWAKFELMWCRVWTKKYAQTPKKSILWILESHFNYKVKRK